MAIWFATPTLEDLVALSHNTLSDHLGIEYTAIGEDYITARMPVDRRTVQPFGLLHGGASVVLSETLGSIGANLCVDGGVQYCVGLEINANHVRSARTGYVWGTATPIHIGNTTQLWQTRIVDEQERLVCISRLTVAVLARKD
ncbi:MAG: hotdog fold thioesterase [Caldilineaceae bacterium]|nr:hotdog fold thioesterase [Caldilineaceae bacterium]